METARLTSDGMIAIPALLRRKLGLHEGSEIVIAERDEGLLLVVKHQPTVLSEEEIQAAMKKGWSREYIENMMEMWKDPDPTFVAPPDPPPESEDFFD